MRYWERHTALGITSINYEDLVTDQEEASRRLLDACGLTWDDKCLQSQPNKGVVATSSKWQVRQPINARSVGRWLNYQEQLGPFMQLFGFDKRP